MDNDNFIRDPKLVVSVAKASFDKETLKRAHDRDRAALNESLAWGGLLLSLALAPFVMAFTLLGFVLFIEFVVDPDDSGMYERAAVLMLDDYQQEGDFEENSCFLEAEKLYSID